jgi:hypothetical protein
LRYPIDPSSQNSAELQGGHRRVLRCLRVAERFQKEIHTHHVLEKKRAAAGEDHLGNHYEIVFLFRNPDITKSICLKPIEGELEENF